MASRHAMGRPSTPGRCLYQDEPEGKLKTTAGDNGEPQKARAPFRDKTPSRKTADGIG